MKRDIEQELLAWENIPNQIATFTPRSKTSG